MNRNKGPRVYGPYDTDYPRPVLDQTGQDSPVQQQFRDENNLARIMKGIAPPNQNMMQPPVYGDMTDQPETLMEYHKRLKILKENFEQLPAETRERFRNEPLEMFDFLSDEKNREEAEKIGLIQKKATEAPDIQKETLETLKEIRKHVSPKVPPVGGGA